MLRLDYSIKTLPFYMRQIFENLKIKSQIYNIFKHFSHGYRSHINLRGSQTQSDKKRNSKVFFLNFKYTLLFVLIYEIVF